MYLPIPAYNNDVPIKSTQLITLTMHMHGRLFSYLLSLRVMNLTSDVSNWLPIANTIPMHACVGAGPVQLVYLLKHTLVQNPNAVSITVVPQLDFTIVTAGKNPNKSYVHRSCDL